jgi:hypothetical protein
MKAACQLALYAADREVPAGAEGHGLQGRLDVTNCVGRGSGARVFWHVGCMSNSISIASGRRVCRTQWRHILQTLACCRLIARQRVTLASDVVRAQRDGWPARRRLRSGGDTCPLSRLDKLLAHKTALFDHLRRRWPDLFASFEVLL